MAFRFLKHVSLDDATMVLAEEIPVSVSRREVLILILKNTGGAPVYWGGYPVETGESLQTPPIDPRHCPDVESDGTTCSITILGSA